ncbi:MAG: STAS domain-containing protein [Planctomycetota bacterium]
MAIKAESKEGVLTIWVQDPRLVEDSVLEKLESDVLTLIDKTTEERVVLAFESVQFMSSSMLGKLVKIQKKCKEYKTKLKLASLSSDIVQVFKITKLDKLFDIEKDVASARKAFLKRGFFG